MSLITDDLIADDLIAGDLIVSNPAVGGPVFRSDQDVDRIANQIDEHYRQRALKL